MDNLGLVYLCGPINGCTDSECKDWREYVKSRLINRTIDPMDRDYRGREDRAVVEIVENDKADIERADALIVNYDKPSVGTSMEILYAYEREKRIVLVCRQGESLSPWLRYHATEIVTSFDEAIKAICE